MSIVLRGGINSLQVKKSFYIVSKKLPDCNMCIYNIYCKNIHQWSSLERSSGIMGLFTPTSLWLNLTYLAYVRNGLLFKSFAGVMSFSKTISNRLGHIFPIILSLIHNYLKIFGSMKSMNKCTNIIFTEYKMK